MHWQWFRVSWRAGLDLDHSISMEPAHEEDLSSTGFADVSAHQPLAFVCRPLCLGRLAPVCERSILFNPDAWHGKLGTPIWWQQTVICAGVFAFVSCLALPEAQQVGYFLSAELPATHALHSCAAAIMHQSVRALRSKVLLAGLQDIRMSVSMSLQLGFGC